MTAPSPAVPGESEERACLGLVCPACATTRVMADPEGGWCCRDCPARWNGSMTGETVHASPLGIGGSTPCCDRTPFDLPSKDRITVDHNFVTCVGPKTALGVGGPAARTESTTSHPAAPDPHDAPCYYRCGLTYHGGLDCLTALEQALERRLGPDPTDTGAVDEGTALRSRDANEHACFSLLPHEPHTWSSPLDPDAMECPGRHLGYAPGDAGAEPPPDTSWTKTARARESRVPTVKRNPVPTRDRIVHALCDVPERCDHEQYGALECVQCQADVVMAVLEEDAGTVDEGTVALVAAGLLVIVAALYLVALFTWGWS